MINFILAVFTLAMIYAGFWLGAEFRTLSAMAKAAHVKVKSWL